MVLDFILIFPYISIMNKDRQMSQSLFAIQICYFNKHKIISNIYRFVNQDREAMWFPNLEAMKKLKRLVRI